MLFGKHDMLLYPLDFSVVENEILEMCFTCKIDLYNNVEKSVKQEFSIFNLSNKYLLANTTGIKIRIVNLKNYYEIAKKRIKILRLIC